MSRSYHPIQNGRWFIQYGLAGIIFCTLPLLAKLAPRPSLAQLKARAKREVSLQHKHRAVVALQQAVNADPHWALGWWDLADLLYQGKQYPAASVAFRRLASLTPKVGLPWAMLGLCEFELRNFGNSLNHIQEGRALGLPNDLNLQAVVIYHEAQDMLVLEEFTQANFILHSFAVVHKPYPGAILAFGLAALHMPLPTEQLSQIISPRRLRLIRRLGQAEYWAAGKKYGPARQRFEALLRQYPKVPYLHYAYAELLKSSGKQSHSEAEFRQELLISPKSVATRLQLAADLMGDGHQIQAMALARAALKLDAGNYAAYYILGDVYFHQNQFQPAWQATEKSKILMPNNAQIRYLLAQIDLRLHHRAAARREQQAFLRLRRIASTYMQKGVLPASVYLRPPAKKKPAHPARPSPS